MINVFGIVIISFIIFYIIKNFKNKKLGKDLYFFSIVSLLVLDIGYIAKIGTFTIEYNYLFSSINFAFAIYYFWKNRKEINKKDITVILFFLTVMLLSLIYPLIFNRQYYSVSFNDSWDSYFNPDIELSKVGFSTYSLGIFARLIIFALSFYVFAKNITDEEIKDYSKKIYYISWGIIGLSIIEFFITNFIDAYAFRKFAFFVFGRSEATYNLQRISFGRLFAPMAFMREPSSYVRTLFIFGINNIFVFKSNEKTIEKKEIIKLIVNIMILILLIIFSNALSGYIYVAGLLFIIWNFITNKKIKIGSTLLVPLFIIIICLISPYRIMKVFETFNYFNMEPHQLPHQSEIVRFYSISNNLKLFFKNFFIGCGFGTIYSHSSVVTLITNVGLIGVAIYLYMLNYISNIAVKKHFFSWLTFITLFIVGLPIGHMSYITYLETFAYQIIILKSLNYLIIKKNIKEKKNQIYVICPYGLVTGGPDALHQMVYYLNNNGFNAMIVYSDIKTHKYNVPDPYKKYISNYLLLNEIDDNSTNAIIVPETEHNLLNKYQNLNKYIWWLSVDNDLNSSGLKNKINKIITKLKWENIKKIYKINTLKNVLQHKKYDFSIEDNVEHLCASYYAFDYVSKNINDKNKVKLCIEPISKIFLEKSEYVTTNKSDIILYNPKKNFEFTEKIIKKAENLKFVPLKGLTQEELIGIYKDAKVYIDFGSFPGAERIPKEAVINGCCILTGRYGASNFYKDVPIPDKYKIEAKEENVDIIIEKIEDLLREYEKNIPEYLEYKNTVLNLEQNFINQINEIFSTYRKKVL